MRTALVGVIGGLFPVSLLSKFAWEGAFLSEACRRRRLTFGWTGNAHLLSKTSTSTHRVPILTVTAVSFCWPLQFHVFTSKNIRTFICKETTYINSSILYGNSLQCRGTSRHFTLFCVSCPYFVGKYRLVAISKMKYKILKYFRLQQWFVHIIQWAPI